MPVDLTSEEIRHLREDILALEVGRTDWVVDNREFQILTEDCITRNRISERWDALNHCAGDALLDLYWRLRRCADAVDYVRWCKLPYWEPHEATLLFMGIDPDKATGTDVLRAKTLPLSRSFKRTAELKKVGRLTPLECLAVASKQSLPIEPKLYAAIESSQRRKRRDDPRRQNSVSSLIKVMARMLKFNSGRQNPLPNRIANLAEEMGLKLKVDTVRDLLHEAHSESE